MSAFRNTLSWIVFLMAGIVLQAALPGIDALLLGVILLIEERDWRTMVWFVPAMVLLQEGTGTQDFGGTVMLIGLCVFLHRLCQPIAQASRLGFSLFFCPLMGGLFMFTNWFIATLEGLPAPMEDIVFTGLAETAWLLAGWTLLVRLRAAGARRDGNDEA